MLLILPWLGKIWQSGHPTLNVDDRTAFSRLQRENVPQPEHMVSTLAESSFRAFSCLLNDGGISTFPNAILKSTEAKQDFNLCKTVIAVAQSPRLNLWELIMLYTLKILRDCVFLCFYIIALLVQQLPLIYMWGPNTYEGAFLNCAVLVLHLGLLPVTILFKGT